MRFSISLLVIHVFLVSSAYPQWSSDPQAGLRVDDGPNIAMDLQAVPDGTGGAVLAWYNYAPYHPADTPSLQRVTAEGQVAWKVADALSPDYNQLSYNRTLVSDGTGNFYTAQSRLLPDGGYVFVQKFNSDGAALWPNHGVRVTTIAAGTHSEEAPILHFTNDGQLIVFWSDNRISGITNFYAQKLNPNGDRQWASDGIRVSEAAAYQTFGQAATDGAGGAILVWTDSRLDINSTDLWGQRISASGQIMWGTADVAVCNAAGYQRGPQVISDKAGGAVLAWEDTRSGKYDGFIQHLNSAGQGLWGANGITVSADGRARYSSQIATDGINVWATWANTPSGNLLGELRAQKYDLTNGSPLWESAGVLVKSDIGYDAMAIDDQGNVVAAWTDANGQSIYAQRLDADGGKVWSADGMPISTAPATKTDICLVSLPDSNFIITWIDKRNNLSQNSYGESINPYAAYLLPNGTLLGVTAAADWQLLE